MKNFSNAFKNLVVLLTSICMYSCGNREVTDSPSSTTQLHSNQAVNREIDTSLRYPENYDLSQSQESYPDPTAPWQSEKSQYIYHQGGTSSWKPEGSQYIYHQDGSSSWQPEGSQYIYHQDGSSSWQSQGGQYIYNQD